MQKKPAQGKKTKAGPIVSQTTETLRYWLELFSMLAFVIVLTKIWNTLGMNDVLPQGTGTASISAAFFVGLIAATSSCLAIVGGLLLSISAAWSEETQGMPTSARLRPMVLFNIGRLAGYFFFGGLIGLVGMILNPGGQVTGFITVILSFVMIGIALRILRLLPRRLCRLPSGAFQRQLQSLAKSQNPFTPLILGALTFFVPCGFTQSMQLLALGTGSFLAGGLLLFAFALGTLPSLLGISLAGVYVRGKASRYFLLFSGVVVLLLGVGNLKSGLLLTGVDAQGFVERQLFSADPSIETDNPFVTVDTQGRQIIAMYVTRDGYNPNHFVIDAKKETWIYAISKEAPAGCASFMQIPTLGASVAIRQGGNWLGPLVPETDFIVTCSMGMFKANVEVR